MKNRLFTIALLCLTSVCYPQLSRQQKLTQIDHEISWYESQERKGAWLVAGGLASSLLSIPAMIPNENGEINPVTLSALNAVGVGLIWWGLSTRWNAQEYLRLLRVKRYDFTIGPLLLPQQGGATGARLLARF